MNINVKKQFRLNDSFSGKAIELMRLFSVTAESVAEALPIHQSRFHVTAGNIVYITGPSGAGKSVLLNAVYEQCDETYRINITDIELEADKAVIDCIDGDVLDSMRYLKRAGICDVYSMLNTPARLSDGQAYRYRLAKAFASGAKYIFADEFGSLLDDITASVLAVNIRHFADTHEVTFFLASSRTDLIADLEPDVIVEKDFSNTTNVIYTNLNKQSQKCHCEK